MILNWIAQYVFLGLVFSTFSQLRQVSQAWIYSLVCFKASLAVLGILWIVSIVGFLVFWNDAALFGSFCAIEIVAMIVVYLIIGITTIVAVSKHQRILVKIYSTEAKFVQKKKQVQIASGFLAGVNFLLLAAYGGVEALNADVEQLVLGALMGAFAGSVLMPLLFIISIYFINELDGILRGEVEVAAEESNTTAFSIA
ncbi:hypothetical protein BDR26DRAFT_854332 [Obelidium mucronatum]|nr:hypothetical protein BDR26DRAFT_854332 [Obelidium mucronatum]